MMAQNAFKADCKKAFVSLKLRINLDGNAFQ